MARFVVLGAAAFLVLCVGVYLLVEVRSKPAEAQGRSVAANKTSDVKGGTAEASTEEEPTTGRRSPKAVTAAEAAGALDDHVRPASANAGGAPSEPDDPGIVDSEGKPGYRLEEIMAEANKAYDRLDLDEARAIAQRVLKKFPTNVRMLRIMVSAACLDGDQPEAQKHFNLLPERDREQMKTRCMRNQITFTDPPVPAK